MIITEKIIYIIVSLIFGLLLISFFLNIDGESFSTKIYNDFFGTKDDKFESVNLDEFYKSALTFWLTHRNSDGSFRKTLYVNGNTNLDKGSFFNFTLENNFCNTIQSKSYNCGVREDTVIEPITLPKLVTLLYENNTLFILNEGELINTRNIYPQITYLPSYLGSGELEFKLDKLPLDAQISFFKFYAGMGSNFNISVNNHFCKDYTISENMEEYNLNDCIKYLQKDTENIILIQFKALDILRNHIKGGQFLILYSTESDIELNPPTKKVFYPAINGSILLFDGINIPGVPTSLDFYLNFKIQEAINGTFKGVFAGETEFEKTTAGEYIEAFTIPSSQLSSGGNSFTLRFFPNSTEEEILIYEPVDVVLITDVSASMIWRMDNFVCDGPGLNDCDFGNLLDYNCNHPSFNDGSTARITVARCFGLEFVNIILNEYNGNQVGLVKFSTTANSFLPLTDDYYLAEQSINDYESGGDTCIGCGIKKAHDLLKFSEKSKVMVLMTDGGERKFLDGKTAKEYAQLAVDDGIDIFTIAFGEHEGSNLLEEIACLTNCSNYAQGHNTDDLEEIYNDFARLIAQSNVTSLKSSKISNYHNSLSGELFGDSYFNINYNPLSLGTQAKILVIDKITNSNNFIFPINMTVELAEFLVWSGDEWVDNILFNGISIFNLSRYDKDYNLLSDSFNIYIPPSNLKKVNNYKILKGNIHEFESSEINEFYLQYIVTIPSSNFSLADYDNALGCHWTVSTPNGIKEYTIPISYKGSSFCTYNYTNSTYNKKDMYQALANYFFREIDLNKNGSIGSSLDFVTVLGGLNP